MEKLTFFGSLQCFRGTYEVQYYGTIETTKSFRKISRGSNKIAVAVVVAAVFVVVVVVATAAAIVVVNAVTDVLVPTSLPVLWVPNCTVDSWLA